MKRLKYLFTVLMLLLGTVAMAQVTTITGTVLDDLKEPIYGANVVVVNSQNRVLKGTVTDFDGNFVLGVPPGKDLRINISFIGMKAQTINFTGQRNLRITLQEDSKMLKATEVTAKRVERSELGISFKEQTGATQKISMAELTETAPVASIEEALQGQAPGMDIVLGGDPGARSSIRIRGTSTLSSNAEPLVVIDGIPTATSFGEDWDFSTANEDDFGALLNISPSDIESIEVLKDAASTAIYGTSGANGVLLITTKQGKTGKPAFTFSSKYSYNEEPATIPLLNASQYISMMQDAVWNAANAKGLGNAASELGILFNQEELLHNPNSAHFREYNVDTDWLSAVRQNAWSTDNSLAVSGGGDKATYRLSLGYYNEVGTTIGTSMKRITANARVTYRFSDKFRVYTDFAFTDSDRDENAVNNVRSKAQSMMPNQSPYLINEDGTRSSSYFTPYENFQGSFGGISSGKASGNWNPVAMAKEGNKNTRAREQKITVNWEWRPIPSIRYEGWVSLNMKTQGVKTFVPQEATGVLWNSSYANMSSEAMTDNLLLQTQNKVMWIKTFAEKHSLVATVLAKTQVSQSQSVSSATYANASANLSDPIAGSVVSSTGSGESETRKVQFTESLNYTYDNRYVLSANFNTEGNSAMGRDKRFATFPSFGVAWNISDEHWFDDTKWFTEGKIRASLGWSGNAPTSGYSYMGAYKSLGSYMNMPAIYPDRMQLDKLKWESKREWDLGADMRFLDRFGFTLDYYDSYTTDCLMKDVSIPSTTGYGSLKYSNSGEVSNKGFEFRIDADVYKTKLWKVNVNFNVARNINKVEKIPANYTVENYTFNNGNYAVRIIEGDPIGSFYGYRYQGVYQNTEDTYAHDAMGNVMHDFNGDVVTMRNGNTRVYPGDAKYEDINHDGVINEQDIVYLGNSNPTLTGGGGFSVKYGNNDTAFGTFNLSVLLSYRYGQKVINSARMNLESMHGKDNQSTAVLRRWRKEGDQTDVPRALYGMGYNYLGSDRFVENASFLRVKSISLSWTMPKKWMNAAHLTSATVFVTGYNLFTFTDYQGQNPEISLPSSPTKLLMDGSTTPISRRFSCGLNLSF